ncbi:MAG: hypothetical protein WBG30_09935, partial [Psychrilyobacter sp.]|uniref:hypothetical protein n=1 Tax=Psychrilyobacter sp. TaxID=2586924 RepID=UPI003C734038
KWEKLKEKIQEYVEDKDTFKENFKEKFEASGRNFVNINVGNHIQLLFDLEYIEQLEKEGKIIEFFIKVMDRVIDIIDKR